MGGDVEAMKDNRYRKDGHDGGGNRHIYGDAANASTGAGPQEAIDSALARQAYAILSKRLKAQAIDKNPRVQQTTWVYRAVRDICRRSSTGRSLTAKQRSLCEKIVGPVETARIRALHIEADIPEVLKNLPKRPPGAK